MSHPSALRSLPAEVGLGLVWHEGKVFIARRAPGGHLPGVWEFPGGKRAGEESLAQCVARECREELGGEVEVREQRVVIPYEYPDRAVQLYVFDCEWRGEVPKVDGGREWRWVEPVRLKRFKFPPANRELIEKLVDEGRQSQVINHKSQIKPGWPPNKPNQLNELTSREWLLFQKSWFIHNPPPREKNVVVHPAKFPETLIDEFIRFFTKPGQIVLDPMLGTGSTLVAAHNSGRRGLGLELNPKYAEIARERLRHAGAIVQASIAKRPSSIRQAVITGDALRIAGFKFPTVDYVITSPPYWDMLRAQGAATQKSRREASELDVHYSDDPRDLGNLHDYEAFVEALIRVYQQVYEVLKLRGYLTIIVKNVKKGGKVYPLAWDLGKRLSTLYTLKDERIWCQDNQRLAPFGMGNAWVSNTFHHYCLNFRKE